MLACTEDGSCAYIYRRMIYGYLSASWSRSFSTLSIVTACMINDASMCNLTGTGNCIIMHTIATLGCLAVCCWIRMLAQCVCLYALHICGGPVVDPQHMAHYSRRMAPPLAGLDANTTASSSFSWSLPSLTKSAAVGDVKNLHSRQVPTQSPGIAEDRLRGHCMPGQTETR